MALRLVQMSLLILVLLSPVWIPTTEICGRPDRLTLYKYGIPSGSPTSSTATSSTATSSTATSSSFPSTLSSSSSTSATVTPSPRPLSGWNSLGCYTDSVAARALSVNSGVVGGPAAMSNEACTAACQAVGYSYSGTEYSGECWCGNTLLNGHGPAPDGSAKCTMTCNGNALEICGGPNRLSLYIFGSAPPSSTITTSTTSIAAITSVAQSVTTTISTSHAITTTMSDRDLSWFCFTNKFPGETPSISEATHVRNCQLQPLLEGQ